MSKSYRAEQDICISGWECGTEIEFKLVVNYKITDYAPQTLENPEEPRMAEIERMRIFKKRPGLPYAEVAVPEIIEDAFSSSDGFKSWLMSEASETEEYSREIAAEARAEDVRMENLS